MNVIACYSRINGFVNPVKIMNKKSSSLRKCLAAWLVAVGFTSIGACVAFVSSSPETEAARKISALGQVVSVVFGPDRKLWRIVPTENFVFVDYSTDYGKTFSQSVAVNSQPKRIRTTSEDRPSIVVDNKGWIYVVFMADGALPWSGFFSLSKDGGNHFSEPVLISDQAQRFKYYQNVIAMNDHGRAYVFWSDEREQGQASGKGNTMYYSPVYSAEPVRLSNYKLKDSMCECCRLAVDFDPNGDPVVFSRTLYDGKVRDHGITNRVVEDRWSQRRVTYDEWRIQACPEHGPALSISGTDRYHMTWFTLGNKRKGIFYAYSDDRGKTLSKPIPLGDLTQLPAHADVLASADNVAVVWREFDGENISIKVMQSQNSGENWSSTRIIASAKDVADYPFLVSDGQTIFVSWNSKDHGYRLLPLASPNAGRK